MKKIFKNFLNKTSGKEDGFKINNETIKTAVNEWFKNPKKVEHTYGHISEWDTSEVTNMRRLFYKQPYFNQPIGNWDVSKVTTMEEMFCSAATFNQDISYWNVSSVTNMKAMFSFANSFNQVIGNWDVSAAKNVLFMFYGAKSFNQDLSSLDVENVTNFQNFSTYATAWVLPKPNFINCIP